MEMLFGKKLLSVSFLVALLVFLPVFSGARAKKKIGCVKSKQKSNLVCDDQSKSGKVSKKAFEEYKKSCAEFKKALAIPKEELMVASNSQTLTLDDLNQRLSAVVDPIVKEEIGRLSHCMQQLRLLFEDLNQEVVSCCEKEARQRIYALFTLDYTIKVMASDEFKDTLKEFFADVDGHFNIVVSDGNESYEFVDFDEWYDVIFSIICSKNEMLKEMFLTGNTGPCRADRGNVQRYDCGNWQSCHEMENDEDSEDNSEMDFDVESGVKSA